MSELDSEEGDFESAAWADLYLHDSTIDLAADLPTISLADATEEQKIGLDALAAFFQNTPFGVPLPPLTYV